MDVMRLLVALNVCCLPVLWAQTTVQPSPSPSPTLFGSTTTAAHTAPAPDPSTSSFVSVTPPYRPAGTCCKLLGADGNCADIETSDPTLWYSHTPEGSNDWCGIDECACGGTNMCADGAQNCGFNDPADTRPCLCASDCFNDDRCCLDYATICSATTPPPEMTQPAPSTTTSMGEGYTTVPTTATTTAVRGSTTAFNATNTVGVDTTVVIIASVSVVVVIIVVILVIFTVRHIKQKKAEQKPLFAASTSNYDGPSSTSDVETPSQYSGRANSTRAGRRGDDTEEEDQPEVELSTRSATYQSSRSGKRSKKSSKKTKKSKKKTKTVPDAETSADDNVEQGASASARTSRRSRRSPSKGKSKSPVGTTPHAHDDVFASPTHHNFEL